MKLVDTGLPNNEHNTLDTFKHALQLHITLAHPDIESHLLMYTDAGDNLWLGVLTKIPFKYPSRCRFQQSHEPLTFITVHFTGLQMGWYIMHVEAVAVIETAYCPYWLLATPVWVYFYTIHHNFYFPIWTTSDGPDSFANIALQSNTMGASNEHV